MKSSVILKGESGDAVMADPVESRFARVESDVQHIRADVADVRVELRRTHDRIDVLTSKMDNGHKELNKNVDDSYSYKEVNKKIDDVNERLSNKIDDVNERLSKKIDDVNERLSKKIDDVNERLSNKIDSVHHSVKDKLHAMTVWALLLYVTLAGGMLTIIGRAFKWI